MAKRGTAVLLILMGLLLGPVYLLSWERLSGKESTQLELTELADRWTLPDGTIVRFAKGRAYKPEPIELKPEMNRIGLRLTFEAATATGSGGTDEYQLNVLQGDQPILQRPVPVSLEPGATRTVDAGSIDVFFPGAYTLMLEAPAAPHTNLARVRVTLRNNVERPIMFVVLGGVALLVVGLALFIEPLLPRSRH